MKNVVEKEIVKYGVNYSDDAYYGTQIIIAEFIYAPIVGLPSKTQLIDALTRLKSSSDTDFMKDFTYADVADFIHTLSDTAVGDELYERFCINYHFASTLSTSHEYKEIIFIKNEGYGRNNYFKIISDDTPITVWLKESNVFEALIKTALFKKNVRLGLSLFGSSENIDFIIQGYKNDNKEAKRQLSKLLRLVDKLKKQIEDNNNAIKELKEGK